MRIDRVSYNSSKGECLGTASRSAPSRARARHALLLCALLLAAGKVAHGWGGAHWKITAAALETLSESEKAHWRPSWDGFKRYCVYPDMGLGNEEAKPYLVVVGGRLLHYFPRDNRADYLCFNEGVETHISRIVAALCQEQYDEAARHAGALTHVIEDLGQPQCHSLEGINGFSWTVLDELFTPEDQTWNRAPQSIIDLDNDPRFKVALVGYTPQLLGTYPAEVAFHLYQRCCRLRQTARKALPGMLAGVYSDNVESALQVCTRPAVETAKVVADMFHTCFAIAQGELDAEALAGLETMDLTSLVPITAPTLISIPYRFSPLAYGCSVSMKRQPVALSLWLPGAGGKKVETTYAKGIGTGCCRFSYEIPAGVFREFRCVAGLHSQLGTHPDGANLRLSIRFRGKEVFGSGVLSAGSLASVVSIAVAAGGTLEFVSEGNPGLGNNYANHAVWAEPVLVRLDPEERARLLAAQREESEALPADTPPKGPDLLPNGSFEEWTENGLPTSWQAHLRKTNASKIEQETKETHSGKSAARLTVDDAGSIAALWCGFTNKPGERYRLAFHWKSPAGVIQYAIKTHRDGGWIAYNGSSWQRVNSNPLAFGEKGVWNRTVVEFPAFQEAMDMTVELCRPGGKAVGYSFLVDAVSLHELE